MIKMSTISDQQDSTTGLSGADYERLIESLVKLQVEAKVLTKTCKAVRDANPCFKDLSENRKDQKLTKKAIGL